MLHSPQGAAHSIDERLRRCLDYLPTRARASRDAWGVTGDSTAGHSSALAANLTSATPTVGEVPLALAVEGALIGHMLLRQAELAPCSCDSYSRIISPQLSVCRVRAF